MAGGKEITTKIRSIENTRKVTSALEMVSASKIRKSQDLMAETRPYAEMIRRVMGHLSKANPEYRHPFTVRREEIRKVGYIVISTDRGLCGGLNINLFKQVLGSIQESETLQYSHGVRTRIITHISWHSPPKCLQASPWPNSPVMSWALSVKLRTISLTPLMPMVEKWFRRCPR